MIAAPPVAETPPPLSEAQVVDRLMKLVSPSRLSLFLSCRLKFFFRYVLGLKKPKSAALHVGGSVHAVLKAWNKARWLQTPLTLKQLHDAYSKAWSEADEPVEWEPGEEDEEKKVGWRLVETYIRESKIPETLKPDAVEVPVEASLHEHGLPKLVGILDLVQERKVIDFKTASQTPNPETVAHTNELQISSYAVLYRHNTGRREEGLELHHLIKTKNPKLVTTSLPPMNDQQQSRLYRQMESYVHGLDVRDFVPSPGIACSYCEYIQDCRAWA